MIVSGFRLMESTLRHCLIQAIAPFSFDSTRAAQPMPGAPKRKRKAFGVGVKAYLQVLRQGPHFLRRALRLDLRPPSLRMSQSAGGKNEDGY